MINFSSTLPLHSGVPLPRLPKLKNKKLIFVLVLLGSLLLLEYILLGQYFLVGAFTSIGLALLVILLL
jgi:hypothetical protein